MRIALRRLRCMSLLGELLCGYTQATLGLVHLVCAGVFETDSPCSYLSHQTYRAPGCQPPTARVQGRIVCACVSGCAGLGGCPRFLSATSLRSARRTNVAPRIPITKLIVSWPIRQSVLFA